MAIIISELAGELHGKQSVLQGWDAVLNLSEASVSDFVQTGWESISGGGSDLEFDAPAVQLTDSGLSIQSRITRISLGGLSLPVPGDASLEISVPLAIQSDSDGQCLGLDFAAGDFKLQNIDIGNGGDIIQEAKKIFAKLSPAIAKLGSGAGVSSMKSAVLESSGGRILQLLMCMDGSTPPTADSVGLETPVPAGAGYSLIINSKALFHEIVERFNGGDGLIKLVAKSSDEDGGAWYAQTRNPMQFQGTVDWAGILPEIKNNTEMGMNFGGSAADGIKISYYTAEGGNIDLDLSVTGNIPIKIIPSGSPAVDGIKFDLGKFSVAATGMAECTVKPLLESLLTGVLADLKSISLEKLSSLLTTHLAFPGHSPIMSDVEIPVDLLIVGSFNKNPV